MIIACMNQKGGVGKTTTVVTLGHALAENGLRTLIVDLDPQGHVARTFGLEKSPGLNRFLAENEPIQVTGISPRNNLWILPGDKTSTDQVKKFLGQTYFSERILRDKLDSLAFKVILLDSAPSSDILHVSALVAAEYILIPTKLDALAIDGVNEILRSYADVAMHGEGRSRGYSIIPTFFERKTKETLAQLDDLVKTFGKHVWPPVPDDVKAREAPAHGQTLWEYAPRCPALGGYHFPDGHRVGGYAQILDRLTAVIDER